MNPDEPHPLNAKAIQYLCQVLRYDRSRNIRFAAIQALSNMGNVNAQAIDALGLVATTDQDETLRKEAVSALAKICKDTQDFTQLNQFLQVMSGQPKVQMNFNAPVTGVAGNVEGDLIINPSDEDLKPLLADLQQVLDALKQKHPTPNTEQTAIAIIDAEYQEIKQIQPWRWQNLLSLQRLWKGSKTAALKIGEHFAEENPWGKGIIGFLEGVSEEVE